jgi:hypothetical protein
MKFSKHASGEAQKDRSMFCSHMPLDNKSRNSSSQLAAFVAEKA